MVAATAPLHIFITSPSNLVERKPDRMEEKMRVSALSDAGGTHSTLKCLVKRGVVTARPPPGGAAPTNITTSTKSFQNNLSLS